MLSQSSPQTFMASPPHTVTVTGRGELGGTREKHGSLKVPRGQPPLYPWGPEGQFTYTVRWKFTRFSLGT